MIQLITRTFSSVATPEEIQGSPGKIQKLTTANQLINTIEDIRNGVKTEGWKNLDQLKSDLTKRISYIDINTNGIASYFYYIFNRSTKLELLEEKTLLQEFVNIIDKVQANLKNVEKFQPISAAGNFVPGLFNDELFLDSPVIRDPIVHATTIVHADENKTKTEDPAPSTGKSRPKTPVKPVKKFNIPRGGTPSRTPVSKPVKIISDDDSRTDNEDGFKIPEAPSAPGAPEAPTAPGAPEAPTAPGAPEAPTAPGAPEAPTAPGAPSAYVEPKLPNEPDMPVGVILTSGTDVRRFMNEKPGNKELLETYKNELIKIIEPFKKEKEERDQLILLLPEGNKERNRDIEKLNAKLKKAKELEQNLSKATATNDILPVTVSTMGTGKSELPIIPDDQLETINQQLIAEGKEKIDPCYTSSKFSLRIKALIEKLKDELKSLQEAQKRVNKQLEELKNGTAMSNHSNFTIADEQAILEKRIVAIDTIERISKIGHVIPKPAQSKVEETPSKEKSKVSRWSQNAGDYKKFASLKRGANGRSNSEVNYNTDLDYTVIDTVIESILVQKD